jgi:hypothetical protein
MNLDEVVTPHPRFARSIRVESDTSTSVINSYLPTGRALDVIRRITRGLEPDSHGRAFSITGPHGSGKSSLGVFVNALLSPQGSTEFQSAHELLGSVDPEASKNLKDALSQLRTTKAGFVPAIVTAEREPVVATVARALHLGARQSRLLAQAPSIAAWDDPGIAAKATPREIRTALEQLTAKAPVLLLIDEFGKNLEAYADSGREGDPYLLQELAEWANGSGEATLLVVTMQHLAFDEYVQQASTSRIREWVKVQGRFEDIAYVETPRQSRHLISAAFRLQPGQLATAVGKWTEEQNEAYRRVGLPDLAEEATAAFPLHPLALGVLPELCSRYGQNERTLFSFLAGPEPKAVPALLRERTWSRGKTIPFIDLADVYDYFTSSASTMIGAAASGGRWIEIQSRIRDTIGLTDAELRVLKSIGVLNLVSAGGTLRASRGVLELTASGPEAGSDNLAHALSHLESMGLITYRDFADEYRIWQGSDFDLKEAVDQAYRACQGRPIEDILNEAALQQPLVASRHSQQFGTLRVFERKFSQLNERDLEPLPVDSLWDGRVLLALTRTMPELETRESDKPIIAVFPHDTELVQEAALEVAALMTALKSAEASGADWVAKRELIERLAIAQQQLRREVSETFESTTVEWKLLGSQEEFSSHSSPSRILSDVADHAYSQAPTIANEVVARRELSSQGAKARRLLVEAMLANPTHPALGIEGYPAERAMYEALLATSGIHRRAKDGTAYFAAPASKDFKPTWSVIEYYFKKATTERVNLTELWSTLQAPPIGLKDGPIPVLLIAALINAQDDVALYEHGTLVLALDDAVTERLVKNPGHFTIKNTASSAAARRAVIAKIADRLGLVSYSGDVTFLGVARRLFARMRALEPYALRTAKVAPATAQMREAFKSAAEPDQLLFHDLPEIFGLPAIPAGRLPKNDQIDQFVDALVGAMDELESAYPQLLETLNVELARALAEPTDQLRRSFSVHASPLLGSVLEPRLKALVLSACQDDREDQEWLENIAMVVADAPAPRSWNDDTVEKFRLSALELGGAFRRVSALISEQKALSASEVDVIPIAVTRVDGREGRLVLWVSAEERQAARPTVDALISAAVERFGTTEKARQVILASLLDERTDTNVQDIGPAKSEVSIEKRKGGSGRGKR